MSDYIPFTDEQKELAASVDLEAFLRRRGEKLIVSGREFRLDRDHSVTVRGNEWYDHAEERGGNAISFVRQFYGLSFQDAMKALLTDELGLPYPAARQREPEPQKTLVPPRPNRTMRRVYEYLVDCRGIDSEVVSDFAKRGLIYEDARYHNAVFVGFDEHGEIKHIHKRSTNVDGPAIRLNGEGSDPRYSFHRVGRDGSLYVFEAPIDMLSFITLHPEGWRDHSYVACCGVSMQPVMQTGCMMPTADTVYLCLDNDSAGDRASDRMEKELNGGHVPTVRLRSEAKDWNEDLMALRSQEHGIGMTL